MVLKFYYNSASPPVRAVYFTVKFLNIPVEMVEINIIDGQLKSEAYMKINPLGTIPCIDDDGFILLDSMVLKLYCDLGSAPVRSVYFTIKYLNLPVEIVTVNLSTSDHKSEEYLKINPLGTIPCIEHNGFRLLDSHAINIYLTTKYPQGEKLYPSDPEKRSIVNERLFFETCELFGALKSFYKRLLSKGLEALDEDTVQHFENAYCKLEIYLKSSKLVAGDNLTIADFSVLSSVSTMKIFVPVNKEKFPSVIAYLDRAVTWPYYAEVNENGLNKLKASWKARNIPFPSSS